MTMSLPNVKCPNCGRRNNRFIKCEAPGDLTGIRLKTASLGKTVSSAKRSALAKFVLETGQSLAAITYCCTGCRWHAVLIVNAGDQTAGWRPDSGFCRSGCSKPSTEPNSAEAIAFAGKSARVTPAEGGGQ
jgi:hypothetical protein